MQASVRVFFYLEDRERTLHSPTDKIMLSLTAWADELERKARQRTYDAMLQKARGGHVTGGRVFGYVNVAVIGPEGRRSYLERRINDDEAAVVPRIFRMCADGAGLTRITKTLNDGRRRGYAFEGMIALDRLLSGVVELPTKMASPKRTRTLLNIDVRVLIPAA